MSKVIDLTDGYSEKKQKVIDLTDGYPIIEPFRLAMWRGGQVQELAHKYVTDRMPPDLPVRIVRPDWMDPLYMTIYNNGGFLKYLKEEKNRDELKKQIERHIRYNKKKTPGKDYVNGWVFEESDHDEVEEFAAVHQTILDCIDSALISPTTFLSRYKEMFEKISELWTAFSDEFFREAQRWGGYSGWFTNVNTSERHLSVDWYRLFVDYHMKYGHQMSYQQQESAFKVFFYSRLQPSGRLDIPQLIFDEMTYLMSPDYKAVKEFVLRTPEQAQRILFEYSEFHNTDVTPAQWVVLEELDGPVPTEEDVKVWYKGWVKYCQDCVKIGKDPPGYIWYSQDTDIRDLLRRDDDPNHLLETADLKGPYRPLLLYARKQVIHYLRDNLGELENIDWHDYQKFHNGLLAYYDLEYKITRATPDDDESKPNLFMNLALQNERPDTKEAEAVLAEMERFWTECKERKRPVVYDDLTKCIPRIADHPIEPRKFLCYVVETTPRWKELWFIIPDPFEDSDWKEYAPAIIKQIIKKHPMRRGLWVPFIGPQRIVYDKQTGKIDKEKSQYGFPEDKLLRLNMKDFLGRFRDSTASLY
jgi:hypothetical protein